MRWDLVVIGGGPGGYTGAIRAAQLGLKTALVERAEVGGTCLNRGCIPTKALLESAHLYREVQGAAAFGVQVEGLSFDYAAMDRRKAQVVEQLRTGVEGLLKGNGVSLIRGEAVIQGPGLVRVGEEELEAAHILIAAGSRPALPPVPGLDLPGVITSDQLLGEGRFYPRLAIIGGGVIGMEFASLYTDLGAEVTVIEAMDRVLPTMDRELSQNLTMLLKRAGARICTGARVERVEESGDGLLCRFTAKGREETVQADGVLVATGRRPNGEGLCAPGVALRMERGGVLVDEAFQTSLPGAYAVGDIIPGNIQLAHVAAAQAVDVVSRLAGREPPVDLSAIPSCVYTRPEIASVGLTEAGAKEQGIPVKGSKYLMTSNGRTLIAGAGRGYIKLVSHRDTGAVLGAQLLCERATDLVGELTAAVREGKALEEVAAQVRAHPTFEEGIGEAAELGLGLSIHQLGR